ncbi:MAG: response regulator [Bacteroidetes bacterium]|nr:MAG: response regulator [Bacteroidota bacterium]
MFMRMLRLNTYHFILLWLYGGLVMACKPAVAPSGGATQASQRGGIYWHAQPFEVQGRKVQPHEILPAPRLRLRRPPATGSLQSNEKPLPALPYRPGKLAAEKKVLPPLHSFPISGKPVAISQPHPVSASALKRKDNAKVNIGYLDVYEGMNAPSVYALLKDKRGFIWIGTVGGGVSRYDGQSFLHFTTENGLSHNTVSCMLEDSRGNLWMGTLGGGVNLYDGNQMIHFTEEDGLGSDYITALLEDSKGQIWIGSRGKGLYRYQPGQGKETGILSKVPIESGEDYHSVLSLIEDQQGRIWIGSWQGALCYEPGAAGASGHISYFTAAEGLRGKSVLSLAQDKAGHIWFGTDEEGVSIYDPQRGGWYYLNTQNGLPHDNVYAMLQDRQGGMWLASDGGGLSRLSLHWEQGKAPSGSISYLNTGNGLSHDNVLALLEDDAGNIWMGTWGGGINRYQPNGLLHLTKAAGLPSNDVRAILEDRDGSLWIGSWGGGITQLEYDQQNPGSGILRTYTTAQGLSLDNILSLEEDREGNLWIGTAGGGLTHFDRQAQVFTHYTGEQGLSGYGVNAIMEDREGNLWLGIDGGGVSLFKPQLSWQQEGRFTHFTTAQGLPHNNVSAIVEDHRGNIWFGTQEGAVCFRPNEDKTGGTFSLLTTENGLKSKQVVCMLEDSRGNMWLGTWGGGLHLYLPDEEGRGGKVLVFSTDNGLNHNWVMGIKEDAQHRIWVNTLKGFTMLQPVDSLHSPQAVAGYQLYSMGEEAGLVRTGFWWNNLCMDSHSRLWWGSAQGLSGLQISQLPLNQTPPKLYLQTIQLNQQWMDYRHLQAMDSLKKMDVEPAAIWLADTVAAFANYPHQLSLPHQLNHLTFHVSAIDWMAPQSIRFAYELEGPEGIQFTQSKSNQVTYTNLPYGTYRLRISARGSSQRWSAPLSFSFRIRPPWWHSWWARLLYALVVLAGLYAAYRYLLSRKLAAEEVRRKAEVEGFKARFFTNITHEFRSPITVIMGMARQIQGHERHKTLILHNSQRLLQLVNQLLDLSKLEAGQLSHKMVQQDIIAYLNYLTHSFSSLTEMKNIQLSFHTEVAELVMDQDAEHLQQIMANLLSNAIKHTPEKGVVKVEVSASTSELKICVQDNGKGIDEADLPHIFERFYQGGKKEEAAGGTGVGLSLVKELVESMGGRVGVSSTPGSGSRFWVSLPIRHEAAMAEALTADFPPTLSEPDTDAGEGEAPHDKLATILIIEDHPDISAYIAQCLQPTYHILRAYDGAEGVKLAFEHVPDLIITDVMMPKKDGYEVSSILKTNRLTAHIPLIMLTAKTSQAEKLQGFRHGADAYLSKPFHEEELRLRIHNLLDIQQKWQARYQGEKGGAASISPQPEDPLIKEARELILTHLDEADYDVEQFARDLGLSRSQLHRKLKAVTGFSATQFINDIRLSIAHEMLLQGKEQVAEVAYATGFEYPNYFAKLYKRKYGQSPSETIQGR